MQIYVIIIKKILYFLKGVVKMNMEIVMCKEDFEGRIGILYYESLLSTVQYMNANHPIYNFRKGACYCKLFSYLLPIDGDIDIKEGEEEKTIKYDGFPILDENGDMDIEAAKKACEKYDWKRVKGRGLTLYERDIPLVDFVNSDKIQYCDMFYTTDSLERYRGVPGSWITLDLNKPYRIEIDESKFEVIK